MAGVEYVISLRDQISPGLRKINQQINGVTRNLKASNLQLDKFKRKISSIPKLPRITSPLSSGGRGGVSSGAPSIVPTGGGFGGLGTALAAGGALLVARNVSKAAIEMNRLDISLKAVSGSANESLDNLEFVNKISGDLGINFKEATSGLVGLIGGFKGTGTEAKTVRKIFLDVSKAAKGLQLDTFRQGLVFKGLSQIASKGVVSMEELRQQIGESMPGAMDAAARSMGVTVAQFNKLVSTGTILSKDFLPKFAEELKNTFGTNLRNATNSFESNMSRLTNEFFKFKAAIGGTLNKALTPLVKGLTKFIPLMSKFKNIVIGGAVSAGILLIVSSLRALRGVLLSLSVASGGIPLIIAALGGLAVAIATHETKIDRLNAKYGDLFKILRKTREEAAEVSKELKKQDDPLKGVLGSFSSVFKEIQDMTKKQRFLFVKGNKDLFDVLAISTKDRFGNMIKELFPEDIRLDKIFRVFRSAARKIKDQTKKELDEVPLIPESPTGGITVTSAAPKIFNINIEKLVDTFNVMTETIEGGAEEAREVVTRALQLALADLQPR